jgi:pyruvate/2-oxoglutarate dehydrogenase complex dihydrolipoamide acyltransferase (E2) component
MRTRTLPFALLLLALGCKDEAKPVVYEARPVERRNIVVSARATGAILPDTVVEVKSKASGEILEMKVETGSVVQRGTLLVRIDRRTPRNRLNQARADLDVAKARLVNAESQAKRADELFKCSPSPRRSTRPSCWRSPTPRRGGRRAGRVDNATTPWRTPTSGAITGTIISKTVERGQVISAHQRRGGWTVLSRWPELVQVRTSSTKRTSARSAGLGERASRLGPTTSALRGPSSRSSRRRNHAERDHVPGAGPIRTGAACSSRA